MFVKSKIKRTIGWCYENGKSFILPCVGSPEGEYIYNVDKLGADINLKACCAITKETAEKYKNQTVYYFIQKRGNK